jgi:TPP-dependent pyruvate/acetoin dehydrogenase alpha subunit
LGQDCLKLARQKMLDEHWATPGEIELMEAEAIEAVQQAVATAQRDPSPDPAHETWQPLASRWLVETANSETP